MSRAGIAAFWSGAKSAFSGIFYVINYGLCTSRVGVCMSRAEVCTSKAGACTSKTGACLSGVELERIESKF